MSIEQGQAKKFRVLIADDNKEMRNTVISLLESEFEVVGAVADGRALTVAAERLNPDVGVIDISMPIMNGIEAVIEIKKHDSHMKVIFLTVNEDADFVRAAFQAGGVGYVVKRQMATDLRIALEKAIAGEMFISPCCDLP
jgi:DNA-binding NarL/FixJ family response regulator